jgi:hypothetical protein
MLIVCALPWCAPWWWPQVCEEARAVIASALPPELQGDASDMAPDMST